MGGAERVEDKRKRQAARAVTAARGGGRGNRGMIVGVALLVLLALVVGFGLWAQSHHKTGALPAAIRVAPAGVSYPAVVQGDAITAGTPRAPVTIDVYEDFLCPACGHFEKLYHQQLEQAAADGKAKVVYHPIAILSAYSVPPGYSTLAAGAALCAAQAGIFPRFHNSLFADQPKEEGPGWTAAQLEQLGRAVGAGENFVSCVQAGAQQRVVTTATENASRYISGLAPDHQFATPTVLVNGALINVSDKNWLSQALSGARR